MKRFYSVTSVVYQLKVGRTAQGGNFMTEKRITADMNIKEMIVIMSDGNPGAIACMLNMLDSNPTALLDILFFDTMEIYGSKIYTLWNDCCGRDMKMLRDTINYIREGNVSKEEVHENLNRVHAEPFI